MKLPLILHAKPRVGLVGPTVFLPEGDWLISSNHRNSSLSISLGEERFPLDITLLKIKGSTKAKIHIEHIGTEEELTIFVHRQ